MKDHIAINNLSEGVETGSDEVKHDPGTEGAHQTWKAMAQF